MAKKKQQPRTRTKDTAKRGGKKKVCVFCKENIDWVDYKDVNLLRRFMSDRAKIRARRVTGNCSQHQREVAVAIKTSRELALLPYATRVSTSRGGGRGGRRRDEDRGGRGDREPRRDSTETTDGPSIGDTAEPATVGVGAAADGDGDV
jgi:small subunit ribosomal protein S18